MNALAPIKTYGSLALNGGKWELTDLPPHVSLRVKSFFARIDKAKTKNFTLADTPDTCSDLLWFMQRFPMRMSPADRGRLQLTHDNALVAQRQLEQILSPEWKPAGTYGFRENRAPYDYQAQAAEIAAQRGSLLLLDEVGLGKTVSGMAAACRAGTFPVAVVADKHLTEQWAEDYIEPFTGLRHHVIKGTKPYELPPADFYLFGYSNYAGWVDLAGTGFFKAVIFDEVQSLRHGRGTSKGNAGHVFARAAQLVLGLTATPIYNYGSEIWNIVELIQPGALGTWYEFVIEWCSMKGQHWIVTDPQALGAYLRELGVVLRRTEADVDSQLPPLNVLFHEIPYDQDVADKVADEARTLALRVMSGSFTERGAAARELDMLARHATGMAKAKGVASLVRMLVEGGRKVLLGGWHRDVYSVWLKELADLNPVMFTGSESAKQKRETKRRFIDGESDLMIMSLRSGTGLDGLQDVAYTAVAGELDWSPQVHRQFFGRLRRPGQTQQVDAIYALTNGGSDPVLVEVNGLKSSQAHGIVDPFDAAPAAPHSDDSRIKKLAQAYLEKSA